MSRPALPLGWYSRAWNLDPARFRVYASAGATLITLYNTSRTSGSQLRRTLNAVGRAGLQALVQIDPTWVRSGRWAAITAFAQRYRASPALYGYYLFDEPELYGVSPSRLAAAYHLLKKEDPQHPIAVAFGNDSCASVGAVYTRIPDIVLFDDYPIYSQRPFAKAPDGEGVTGIPLLLDRCLGYLHLHHGPSFRGFIPILQAFSWGAKGDREPTYGEIRFMLFASLIRPVLGVQFWVDYRASARMREIVDRLSSEVRPFAAALADGRYLDPTVHSGSASIRYKVGRLGDDTIVFALNEGRGNGTPPIRQRGVRFTVLTEGAAGSDMRVFSELFVSGREAYREQRIRVQKGGSHQVSFTADFAPFEAHIFRIRGTNIRLGASG